MDCKKWIIEYLFSEIYYSKNVRTQITFGVWSWKNNFSDVRIIPVQNTKFGQ